MSATVDEQKLSRSETLEGLRVNLNAASPRREPFSETEGYGEQPLNGSSSQAGHETTIVDHFEGKKVRSRGVVKWFNPTKGFGFITPEDGGIDVFVHQSEIQLGGFRSLAQGESVEYDLLNGEKGPKALKVTGPNGAAPKGAPRERKVVLVDGNQTYLTAQETKKVQHYVMSNQVPVFTSHSQQVTTVPYSTPSQYSATPKRYNQYPLSPKQVGFVHSPVAHTSSYPYQMDTPPSRYYNSSNSSWANSGMSSSQKSAYETISSLLDSPVAQNYSPQFQFPYAHTTTSTIPLSPTFTNYHTTSQFSFPLSPTVPSKYQNHYSSAHQAQTAYSTDHLTHSIR